MKKVFISVGMNGREFKEVIQDIHRARLAIMNMFDDDQFEIIHNNNCVAPDGAGRLYYLGEAIKKLDGCDACYFVKGWQNHKGCLIEYEVCKLYGIEIVEEA